MALIFLLGEEPIMGLSLTTFLWFSEYMEILAAMLGLGAIFFKIWSLFFLAISSFTNSFDLSMILFIFYICFFFIYSLAPFTSRLFSLSSLTLRLRVLPRELLLMPFLTGDSLRERVRGLTEFMLGKMLTFSLETTTFFFFSFSLRMES